MANWYSTYFETKDKEIVELIKNGQTMDFDYDEKKNCGYCSLRWGLNAIDMDKISNIAKENHSSFLIRSSDYLSCTMQTWAYENGKEKEEKVEDIKVAYT